MEPTYLQGQHIDKLRRLLCEGELTYEPCCVQVLPDNLIKIVNLHITTNNEPEVWFEIITPEDHAAMIFILGCPDVKTKNDLLEFYLQSQTGVPPKYFGVNWKSLRRRNFVFNYSKLTSEEKQKKALSKLNGTVTYAADLSHPERAFFTKLVKGGIISKQKKGKLPYYYMDHKQTELYRDSLCEGFTWKFKSLEKADAPNMVKVTLEANEQSSAYKYLTMTAQEAFTTYLAVAM